MNTPKTAAQINAPQTGKAHSQLPTPNSDSDSESFWDRIDRRRKELAAAGLYPVPEVVIPLADWNVIKWAMNQRHLKKGDLLAAALRCLVADTAKTECGMRNAELPEFVKDWLADTGNRKP